MICEVAYHAICSTSDQCIAKSSMKSLLTYLHKPGMETVVNDARYAPVRQDA